MMVILQKKFHRLWTAFQKQWQSIAFNDTSINSEMPLFNLSYKTAWSNHLLHPSALQHPFFQEIQPHPLIWKHHPHIQLNAPVINLLVEPEFFPYNFINPGKASPLLRYCRCLHSHVLAGIWSSEWNWYHTDYFIQITHLMGSYI